MTALALRSQSTQSVADYLDSFDELNIIGVDCTNKNAVECINLCRPFKQKMRGTEMGALRTASYNIKRFEDMMCGGRHIYPQHFTDQLWTMIIRFWQDDCCLSPNTINKMCSNICASLDWSAKHGAKIATTYRDYHVEKDDVVRVILSSSEIAKIYYFDFESYSKNNKGKIRNIAEWNKARDMFVLQCNLGQRASDMFRLEFSMFREGNLKLKQQKTKADCVVDLKTMTIDAKITKEILERYNYQCPFPASISSYNRKIKQMMQIIGIDSPVTIDKVVNGKVTTITEPKWMHISSHTARRSYISYQYLYLNKTSQIVRRASGHKSDSAFQLYAVHAEDYEA